jgi:hypothetical protein
MIVLNYGPQGALQAGRDILLEYALAVSTRRVANGRRVPWGASAIVRKTSGVPHSPTMRLNRPGKALWNSGTGKDRTQRLPWIKSQVRDDAMHAPWGGPIHVLQPDYLTPWGMSRPTDDRKHALWSGPLEVMQVESLMPLAMRKPVDDRKHALWLGPMFVIRPRHLVDWTESKPSDVRRYIPWTKYSQQLRSGWMVVTLPSGPEINAQGTVLVPIRQVYLMLNLASLNRVDDGAALPVLSLSASIDVDSWGWRVEALLPASSIEAVMPGMDGACVLLQATLNGHPLRWMAERVSLDRVFGQARIRVSGRSPSAVLSDPYAVNYSFASSQSITAQQAAIAAITAAGLPLGWSLAWHVTDWLLPAGLWQHQGTPMSALLRIAQAAGAYVQTDAVLSTLHVHHRYPSAPWNWESLVPDVVLPIDVVSREAVEWVDKPGYNEVYVSGEALGVLGHAVKSGTTGGLGAPMVVDDLLTQEPAARQRAQAILSDTGRQQRITLSLPITEEIGLLQVGQLIDITDGAGPAMTRRRGLVRSVSIAFDRPSARQTVEVQAHV